jgi:HK97 family phage prohead protease
MPDIREAAAARQAAMRTAGDRPRRRSASTGPVRDPSTPALPATLTIREAAGAAGDEPIEFEGYASVFEHGYRMFDMFGEYTEVIAPGAFASCLSQAPDVPLVLQHDPMKRVASTSNGSVQLTEDTTGLRVTAQLDAADQDVQYIVPKIRAGLISEMSYRFNSMDGDWSPDFSTYRVTSLDLNRGDVSIVAFGANPATTAAVRAQNLSDLLGDASVDDVRYFIGRANMRLRDLGAPLPMTREELARIAVPTPPR